MELSFKPFDHSVEFPNQRKLFTECFPETVGSPTESGEHYTWKFHSLNHSPSSYEYGAYLGNEMIGYYAAVPYRYGFGKNTYTAGMVCDVMTGVLARGKGVFTKLGIYSLDQMRLAGLDFTTGYPIRPEVIPGHLKAGWKIVTTMPIYIKVLKTNAILKSRKVGFLAPIGNLGAAAYNFIFKPFLSGNNYRTEILNIEEFLSLDKEYENFLQKWLKSVKYGLVKDSDFLSWRFGAPGSDYQFIVARDGKDQMAGVCITRKTVLEKIPALAILDIMTLPGHHKAFRKIAKTLGSLAHSFNCEIIASMIQSAWAKKYFLKSSGFIRSPFIFSLIIKKLNINISDSVLFDPQNWHVMWIDSDDL